MTVPNDISALVSLLKYAESEAERLGLAEAAQLLNMPIESICENYVGVEDFNPEVDDGGLRLVWVR